MKKIFIYSLLFFGFGLYAQQKKDTVKTEVIEVVKSFNPEVQDAFKLNISPDSIQVIEKKIPVEIAIQSVPVASTFEPEKGSMSNFQFQANHHNFLSSYALLGFGNYGHIWGQTYINHTVTEKLQTAIFLNHFSTQGKSNDSLLNSAYNTSGNMIFNYKNEKNKWLLDLGYQSKINHLNPSPLILALPANNYPSYDDLRKNNFFSLRLDGILKESVMPKTHLDFIHFWDDGSNNETKLSFISHFIIPIGDFNLKTQLKSDLVSGNAYNPVPDNIEKNNYSNFDIGLIPAFSYSSDNLKINFGAKLYYQNHEDFNKIQILPDLHLDYGLIFEMLNLFAGLQGDIYQNSFENLLAKNPYLVPQEMKPMLKPINLYGGIRGNFSSSFSYELKMGYRKFNNYAFFRTLYSPNYLPYGIFYDDLTQSFFASEINIAIGRKLDFKLHFEYDQNNTEILTKALFLPDYSVKAFIFFHPTENVLLDMALFSEGNRPGDLYNPEAYTDLNLKILYKINNQFTAFIKGNNLLNKSYDTYSYYPVEKIQIMGGVMYKFDTP